ncbi:two-component system, NtrC family, C4-dicarboxylate transport sensor histidine kinase DctB [Noviherbaspirillum humi]|uniref:C4-dicarboxylate transport sensor protein DctB n=1 Tax=Noviherbaspirillum humi TaxID=1688639 RepID=A0A239HZU8_9BURK|nr:ATP-binding protein [Noviherbaspirillum humi]SNS86900.1 two-component system, NtrC family, C4-dicarboxylate transport sensor histidine kinase DctB [Noviherbaspirillum humi]
MRRAFPIVVLCAVLAATGGLAYLLSWQYGVSAAKQAATVDVARYADNLKGRLERNELLPYLIAQQAQVRDVLQSPSPGRVAAANAYLAEVNQRARMTALYVIAADGTALAASNWNRPDSFVGGRFAFRPYFQAAMQGGTGRFYGIGTTVGEPGYFVSQPVRDGGRIIGVVAAKINLEWFRNLGDDRSAPLVVSDEHRIIFLSSLPQWQYRAQQPLPPDVLKTVQSTRQYHSQQIRPLSFDVQQRLDGHSDIVAIPAGSGRHFLAAHHQLDQPDWQVTYYVPLAQVRMNARIAALAAVFAVGLACALAFTWRQRRQRTAAMKRSRIELEQRVAERTADLNDSNRRLQQEVQERVRAESELRAAQSELVQASKLAALGQMAAGITHELNQPLAALRSFSDNTRILLERGEQAEVKENLQAIADLTDRMGKITGQLRQFAGKSRPRDVSADLTQAINNSLSLLRGRLHGIEVAVQPEKGLQDARVWCDPLQLEQVLINLIGNAAEALREGQSGQNLRIEVIVDAELETVRIRVRDNGPGIAADALPRLFEPFFTTRQGGLGLGLPISSSIAQEYGGQLEARNTGSGAEFILSLRRAALTQDQHDIIL